MMKNLINVEVINKSNHDLPKYATRGSVGVDVRACLDETEVIASGHSKLIPTGLFMAIPEGYEAQVRPKSGLANTYVVTVLNTPGTVDSDFRGNVGVMIINHGEQSFAVKDGDYIGQLVFAAVVYVSWVPVEVLPPSDRGEGGFGSTGRR